MSNKHKLLLVLPVLSLVIGLFAFTSTASAAICSDTKQTSVPQDLGKETIFTYCAKKGGVPILYERNNTQQCINGSQLSDEAREEQRLLQANNSSTEVINKSLDAICRKEGLVGYDPAGRRRCDDGLNLDKVDKLIGPEANATHSQLEEWCQKNGHVGYSYATPAEGDESVGDSTDVNCSDSASETETACNPIVTWLRRGVNFLSAGVMVVVIAMIIIGGIQYSYAGGDPNGVAEAKKKITNAVIALLAYIFLYAFIQYLIPGGVF